MNTDVTISKQNTATLPITVDILSLNPHALNTESTTSIEISEMRNNIPGYFGRQQSEFKQSAAIEEYLRERHSVSEETQAADESSLDSHFFSLSQEFAAEQVDLDEDFTIILNEVTREVGKNSPKKNRL